MAALSFLTMLIKIMEPSRGQRPKREASASIAAFKSITRLKTSLIGERFSAGRVQNRTIDEKTLRGRFFREEYPAGENFQKVQFENEQIRITRLVCAPGKRLDMDTKLRGNQL